MAKVSTSHFKIADYWRDKYILPNGDITDFPEENALQIVTDFGEPSCWGCGKPIIGHYEKHLDEYMEDDLTTHYKCIWNDPLVKKGYNRCHIIPGALGGGDCPNNLFLMCENCHTESPDTTNPKSFFRWVYLRRSKYNMGELSVPYLMDAVSMELKQRGLVSVEELLSTMTKFDCPTDKVSLEEYIEQNMGQHGVHSSESSRTCVIADWLMKTFLQASLKSSEGAI